MNLEICLAAIYGIHCNLNLTARNYLCRIKPGCRKQNRVGKTLNKKIVALYLTRFSYTPETWARLTKNPEDRREAARKYIESVGGKLHGFWYAFGEYDGYNLWEAPDNVSMAAVVIAIGGGGALSKVETTVLLSVEDTLIALGKAQSINYRQPGK